MKTFAQQHPPVEAIAPAAGGSALTGDYISLKNGPVAVVVHITQGNAATVALTIEQATAVAGTSSKAITTTVPIFSNLDCAAGDTLTRRTAAVSYTTDAGVKHKIVVFEINPRDLDVANGFDCITVKAAASNAANILAAQYIPKAKRFSGDSLITD